MIANLGILGQQSNQLSYADKADNLFLISLKAIVFLSCHTSRVDRYRNFSIPLRIGIEKFLPSLTAAF